MLIARASSARAPPADGGACAPAHAVSHRALSRSLSRSLARALALSHALSRSLARALSRPRSCATLLNDAVEPYIVGVASAHYAKLKPELSD